MWRETALFAIFTDTLDLHPMKIIHTADWHIGHELYGYDREADFEDFFARLVRLMAEEQPDALLVSGDVYDSYMPSNAAVKQLNTTLLSLHEASPETEIILTAGNHDSGLRLEAAAPPWLSHRIHLIGTIDPTLERNRIEIEGKGVVMAIPFCYPANFPHQESDKVEERQKSFFQRVSEQLSKESLPKVLMAHLYLSGARLNGTRQPRDIVGGSEAMPLSDIGTGYDYLALGHIHRRQQLSNQAHYSGSPLPISFDEPAEHGVLVVELHKGKAPRVDFRQMKTLRPLLTLPEQAVSYSDAIDLLRTMDADEQAYIRLHVLGDKPLPFDYLEQATKALEGKSARYCTIKVESPESLAAERVEQRMVSPDELNTYSPQRIVEMYLKDQPDLSEEGRKELLDLFGTIDEVCSQEGITI